MRILFNLYSTRKNSAWQPGGNMQHRKRGLWCWRRYHTGKFPFSVRNLITPPTVKDGLALDRNGVTINHLASRIDFSQPAEGQNLRPIRSGQWRCYATNISMKFLFYSSNSFFPAYQHIKTDLQFSVQRERLRLDVGGYLKTNKTQLPFWFRKLLLHFVYGISSSAAASGTHSSNQSTVLFFVWIALLWLSHELKDHFMTIFAWWIEFHKYLIIVLHECSLQYLCMTWYFNRIGRWLL